MGNDMEDTTIETTENDDRCQQAPKGFPKRLPEGLLSPYFTRLLTITLFSRHPDRGDEQGETCQKTGNRTGCKKRRYRSIADRTINDQRNTWRDNNRG